MIIVGSDTIIFEEWHKFHINEEVSKENIVGLEKIASNWEKMIIDFEYRSKIQPPINNFIFWKNIRFDYI